MDTSAFRPSPSQAGEAACKSVQCLSRAHVCCCLGWCKAPSPKSWHSVSSSKTTAATIQLDLWFQQRSREGFRVSLVLLLSFYTRCHPVYLTHWPKSSLPCQPFYYPMNKKMQPSVLDFPGVAVSHTCVAVGWDKVKSPLVQPRLGMRRVIP